MDEKRSTVSAEEILKFEAMAYDWWNPIGSFKPLHQLTPLRIESLSGLIPRSLLEA
jgi:2-polyprenyl-6-hydroxyphenyl methylase/3-demethylubiquinone-9 3-methyltransferase